LLVTVASIAAVINGSALPVNTVSSLAIGWGVAAGLHLAVGSPLGLPSAQEITSWITDLGVPAEGITRHRVLEGIGEDLGGRPGAPALAHLPGDDLLLLGRVERARQELHHQPRRRGQQAHQ